MRNSKRRTASDVVQVTFLPGWRLPNGNHMAAVRIALAPGWKTYWRAPGEGGVPTVISLTEAQGVSGMAIHWPRPQVFFANGMRSIGYYDDVILPVEFALTGDGEVEIAGQIDLGVCLDVCMPVTLDLAGLLPPGTTRVSEIGAALAERPLTATEAGAGHATCSVQPIADGLQVTVSVALPVDRRMTRPSWWNTASPISGSRNRSRGAREERCGAPPISCRPIMAPLRSTGPTCGSPSSAVAWPWNWTAAPADARSGCAPLAQGHGPGRNQPADQAQRRSTHHENAKGCAHSGPDAFKRPEHRPGHDGATQAHRE